MTDNFVPGVRQNFLVGSGGTRLAAANPADPLANLSLAFLGDPAYADGRAAATTDFLDAANGSYQQDAQRMRAAGYRDRAYGRAVTTGGKTWLQYWLFSYYNPQNVLGFGVHEGDWEFIQVGLDADGAPDVATYGQHDGGERCAWSAVAKTAAGAPVVYVALASHASYFAPGVNPRGFLPDDHHRGGGYQVAPALEIVTPSTPFMAWRGKWGASSSSPLAPRRQGKWSAPNSFNSGRGRVHRGRHPAVGDGAGPGARGRGARAAHQRPASGGARLGPLPLRTPRPRPRDPPHDAARGRRRGGSARCRDGAPRPRAPARRRRRRCGCRRAAPGPTSSARARSRGTARAAASSARRSAELSRRAAGPCRCSRPTPNRAAGRARASCRRAR